MLRDRPQSELITSNLDIKSSINRQFLNKVLLIGFVLLLLTFLTLNFYVKNLNVSPPDFPSGEPIIIEEGTDVKRITEILQERNVVKSKHLLYYILIFFHEPTSLKASTYVFDEPITTTAVASRLTEGDFDTNLIRFTHFEGERASQIAKRASEILPSFNVESFLKRVEDEGLEGKLFPETYLLPAEFTDQDLLELLTKTFSAKTEPLAEKISSHKLSLEEILVLASIIEREANSLENMKLVSSVLQNRLEIGMPLQADASIEYILDKPLAELTPEDLKIDSPYNTYLHTGLPPTPIGNPGLSSIQAVLEPTESDYFYYITDEKGDFYFAKTYKEHKKNIERYLR